MPRPSQTRPHVVRPVEDITEGELQLVADQMTEKVYDKVNVKMFKKIIISCNCVSILRYFTIYQMLTLMLLLMKSEEAEVEVGSMKNFDRVLFVSFVFLAYGTHHIHNITKHVNT